MSGIWTKTDRGWQAAIPQKFKKEKDLHDLVVANVGMLPLAGSPRLYVLGREVQLGRGYADLVAVEVSGRPVIAEVKLEKATDAKRAIVSQILAYASYLQGIDVKSLAQGPLRRSLAENGHTSILDAAEAQDQEKAIDPDQFETSLQEYLTNGMFRLVLILDETSVELERLIGYLDSVTRQSLTIDLITFSIYKMNGTEIVMPQRISPDTSMVSDVPTPRVSSVSKGVLSEGLDVFVESIAGIDGVDRAKFDQLLKWANAIAELPGVKLFTYAGVNRNRFTLLPRLITENAGLVTIWNDNKRPYVSFWRGVFERRAPKSIDKVEQAADLKIGQGNVTSEVSDMLLETLHQASREATNH